MMKIFEIQIVLEITFRKYGLHSPIHSTLRLKGGAVSIVRFQIKLMVGQQHHPLRHFLNVQQFFTELLIIKELKKNLSPTHANVHWTEYLTSAAADER